MVTQLDPPEVVPDPSQPRCPFLLMIDTSGSMDGDKIREVNAGLKLLAEEFRTDTLARQRIWVGVQTFGGTPRRHGDFVSALNFVPPELTVSGDTPMGAAVLDGMDWLQAKRREYRDQHHTLYVPIAILLTDGQPTDRGSAAWQTGVDRLRRDESEKKVALFKFAVGGGDFSALKELGIREPLRIAPENIRETFVWITDLGKSRSASSPAEALLPPQIAFGSPI